VPRLLDDTTFPHRQRPRRQNEIAEPILRPDEFSNDGADHCQSYGDFQSDNNESHRRRDSNLDERRIYTDSASGMLIAIDSAKHCKVT